MAKGITPITSTNDINAIVRQVNQNFQILSNRTVAGNTNISYNGASGVSMPGTVVDTGSQFAVYYDNSGLARVLIGTITSTGEEIIAISSEGVNVLNAVKRNPIIPSDFYFNTSLVNTSISNLQTTTSDLSTRMTTAEGNITTNSNDISNIKDEVADLDDRITLLENKMTNVESTLADHEARIQALEGNTPNP